MKDKFRRPRSPASQDFVILIFCRDENQDIFVLQNGVFDLNAKEFRKTHPDDYAMTNAGNIQKSIPVCIWSSMISQKVTNSSDFNRFISTNRNVRKSPLNQYDWLT